MNGSVLIAMSGGVDSSVAALKLLEAGFHVEGATMRHWGSSDNAQSIDRSIEDARQVAAQLGIGHHILDVRNSFSEMIIDYFVNEYKSGRTPNPCVICNPLIKWGELWKLMENLGLDYIATGHYARILKTEDGYGLFKASRTRKDQSYVLYRLDKDKLAGTILPLGDLDKAEVRRLAAERGLKTAARPESQEICFIPDNDYGKFLKMKGIEDQPGEIIDHHGNLVGTHDGIIYYTIGQRKGLGGGFPEPMFVYKIDPVKSRIHIAPRQYILYKNIEVTRVNWLLESVPQREFSAQVKIRYADGGRAAEITPIKADEVKIFFPEGAEAPTPGQSAVFYLGQRLLGGGIIDKII